MHNVLSLKGQNSRSKLFEALVRPHFGALYTAARRMSQSPDDAEDLVQEVCLKAFERLEELENIEFQRAWLLKVLYHKFVDTRRAHGRSPVNMAETGADSKEPDAIAERKWQPEDMADRSMRIDRVLRAMSCLNRDQCALVALHDVEGLTISELQELTGKPAGTIKAQLHRTRAKLGRLMLNDALLQPHLKVIGGKR